MNPEPEPVRTRGVSCDSADWINLDLDESTSSSCTPPKVQEQNRRSSSKTHKARVGKEARAAAIPSSSFLPQRAVATEHVGKEARAAAIPTSSSLPQRAVATAPSSLHGGAPRLGSSLQRGDPSRGRPLHGGAPRLRRSITSLQRGKASRSS